MYPVFAPVVRGDVDDDRLIRVPCSNLVRLHSHHPGFFRAHEWEREVDFVRAPTRPTGELVASSPDPLAARRRGDDAGRRRSGSRRAEDFAKTRVVFDAANDGGVDDVRVRERASSE